MRAKLRADPSLKPLLLATCNHPLLSIKADLYWGFDAKRGGKNQLALMWMQLRSEMALAPTDRDETYALWQGHFPEDNRSILFVWIVSGSRGVIRAESSRVRCIAWSCAGA